MPDDRLTGFSSAFDDLLERTRRELDALSGEGSGASALSPTPRTPSRPPAPLSTDSSAHPSVAARGAAQGASTRPPTRAQATTTPPASRSPAERALDERLGAGWRHEVLDRTREGGELVVRCRVTAPAHGVTRTWFGSAPLSGAGGAGGGGGVASGTRGMAGDVPFTLGREAGPDAGPHDSLRAEREAERQAIESALAACARLL